MSFKTNKQREFMFASKNPKAGAAMPQAAVNPMVPKNPPILAINPQVNPLVQAGGIPKSPVAAVPSVKSPNNMPVMAPPKFKRLKGFLGGM